MTYAVATAALFACLFVWARWFRVDPELMRWKRHYLDVENVRLDLLDQLKDARIRTKQSIREDDAMTYCLHLANHNDAQHELIVDFVLDLQKMCDRYERRGREVEALGVKEKPQLTVTEDEPCKTP